MNNEIVRVTIDDLRAGPKDLGKGVELFGEYPFMTEIDGKEQPFWCEYVRVHRGNDSMVFRLLTRMGYEALWPGDGQENLRQTILIDNRSNLERELSSPTLFEDNLFDAYRKLADPDSEVAGVLIPMREGAMGSTEQVGGLGPFTKPELKFNPHVWDLDEEVEVARAHVDALLAADAGKLAEMHRIISDRYQNMATPLVQLLSGEAGNIFDEGEVFNPPLDVDFRFYDEEVKTQFLQVNGESRQVDQMVAYPYLTDRGLVYVRLFRVWDADEESFEVVRVVQTKPDLKKVDYLRIDSNCTDGVHAKDTHCECEIQFWATIQRGFDEDKNTVVIQMADHEGKGWGAVFKGATHRVMRISNATFDCNFQIGNAAAAAMFYDALGQESHDHRDYDGAQAIAQFLEITEVEMGLMGNNGKVKAMRRAGVTIRKTEEVQVSVSVLSSEARRTLDEKHRGLVIDNSGKSVIYAATGE